MNTLSDLRNFSLKVKNLKCFEDWQGFDSIYPVNVIVGRNNSGKSTLLDLVWQATKGFEEPLHYSRKGQPVSAEVGYTITKEAVEKAFGIGKVIFREYSPSGNLQRALQMCCEGEMHVFLNHAFQHCHRSF
jgi:ABC-type uncharacterized transport system ATPase subunit